MGMVSASVPRAREQNLVGWSWDLSPELRHCRVCRCKTEELPPSLWLSPCARGQDCQAGHDSGSAWCWVSVGQWVWGGVWLSHKGSWNPGNTIPVLPQQEGLIQASGCPVQTREVLEPRGMDISKKKKVYLKFCT